LRVGNTDPTLPGGPDTSSNTTQLDKDNLNAEPTLVLTNQNGDGVGSRPERERSRWYVVQSACAEPVPSIHTTLSGKRIRQRRPSPAESLIDSLPGTS
jgi:hypothetical protein